MSKFGMPDVSRFLISGRSFLGSMVQNFTISTEAIIEETTGSGHNSETWAATGVTAGEITQDGLMDDATDANHDYLKDVGGTQVIAIAPGPDVIGNRIFVCNSAITPDYKAGMAVKSFTRLAAKYVLNAKGLYGVILHALGAETGASGDTESSSVDDTADSGESTEGGLGVVQVTALALGGYDSVTVTVEHSDDDTTFAALITFTVIATAPVGYGAEVAGIVDRYLASSYAFNGAGSSQSITYLVGFARMGEPPVAP